MKILIVASYNKGRFAPFIVEQANALIQQGVKIDYFGITGKGIIGYLKSYVPLIKKIKQFKPDVIHAHYGLSGLLANLQRCIPVVTTYHGSDINDDKSLWLSKMSIYLSKFNIFVSRKNIEKASVTKKFILLPCGINIDDYPIVNKNDARKILGWTVSKKYVVFAGAFDNKVKNYPLAAEAISLMNDDNVELIELKGYNRQQVALLFSAADVMLLTSFSEGSPQVVKEAMACGCPIVSVDVGDVEERLEKVRNCYVLTIRNAQLISDALLVVFSENSRTNGRECLEKMHLDNVVVASTLMSLYRRILNHEG